MQDAETIQTAPTQLTLDGFPIEQDGIRFSLRSANRLYLDRRLDYNERVQGTWEGRVRSIRSHELSDGNLLAVYDIEVLDAAVEYLHPSPS